MDVTVQAAWIGVIGTVIGGAGFKTLEYFQVRMSKKRDQITEDDVALELRDELREDVANLRKELHQVEEELAQWRGKYYTLLEKFIVVKANLETALKQIEEESGKNRT